MKMIFIVSLPQLNNKFIHLLKYCVHILPLFMAAKNMNWTHNDCYQ